MDYSDKYEELTQFMKLFAMKSGEEEPNNVNSNKKKKKHKKKKNKLIKEGQTLSINEINSKIIEKKGSFNTNKTHKERKKMKNIQKRDKKSNTEN